MSKVEPPPKKLFIAWFILVFVLFIGVIISRHFEKKTKRPRWEDMSNAELPALRRQMLHEDSIAKGLKADTLKMEGNGSK
ncbi:MAG: hypothetical protein LBU62_06170 [Bacteroidales bacterium]|jgi:hypothetical protein|nr:hypothetical protein [Bacteroidales bacterium]